MIELELAEGVALAHALVDRVARDSAVRAIFVKGPIAVAQGLRTERQSVDVDVLVDPARSGLVVAALSELGWQEQIYATPTAATYSRTLRHRLWPCELDVHVRFPGFLARPEEVFELLWDRHDTGTLAARELPCLDRTAQALLLGANALRDPHQAGMQQELADLVERVRRSFTGEEISDLARLAGDVGAAETCGALLAMVGAPTAGRSPSDPDQLRAWRLRTQPEWRVATWIESLRAAPKRSWPRMLWYAAVLSESELRTADPQLPPGRMAVAGARVRRLRRGVRSLRAARRRRSDSGVEHSGQEVAVRTTWRSLRVPGAARAGAGTVIAGLDRLLPTKRGVVVRTFPDFDDQGLELAAALVSSGLGPVTWLVKDPRSAAASARRLPAETSMVEAGSLRGLLAYLRARVVVHTHGLYAVPGRSSRKLFVNLWHGMPVKRLDHDPPVARRQTDVLTVTAPLYAGIIAEEWSLPAGRAVALGLPRNDRMVRAADEPVPASLLDLAEGRPLVVWLPTYRRSVTGSIRVDGRDFSNAFELPGADAESVRALADRLGIHLLVKTHPMAPPPPETGNAGALTVWDEAGLAAGGVTLYELLGHAAALVTDHSSVWVDYLLLDRPVVFSIADMEQYAATRGHYFTPLAEHLPGPVAEDLAQLGVHLGQALHEDPWAARRGELRSVHHTHLDGHSAERVADLVRRRASSVAGGGS